MLAQVSFILDTSLLFVCHLPLGEEEKNKKKPLGITTAIFKECKTVQEGHQ